MAKSDWEVWGQRWRGAELNDDCRKTVVVRNVECTGVFQSCTPLSAEVNTVTRS